jgi:uncharacterized membrane protein
MTRLVSYFFKGVVFVVPIGVTVWLLTSAFMAVDHWVGDQVPLPFPGLGVAAMVVVITMVGFLTSNFLTRRLVGAFERIFDRLPVVKMVHGSLKDLLSAFVGTGRKFDRPVVVSMDAEGRVKAVGFVTRDDMTTYKQDDSVAVYFPQAYNFAGQVALVPRHAITALDLAASDVMTFIVSGGISGK